MELGREIEKSIIKLFVFFFSFFVFGRGERGELMVFCDGGIVMVFEPDTTTTSNLDIPSFLFLRLLLIYPDF